MHTSFELSPAAIHYEWWSPNLLKLSPSLYINVDKKQKLKTKPYFSEAMFGPYDTVSGQSRPRGHGSTATRARKKPGAQAMWRGEHL